jgi:hypothetical protein
MEKAASHASLGRIEAGAREAGGDSDDESHLHTAPHRPQPPAPRPHTAPAAWPLPSPWDLPPSRGSACQHAQPAIALSSIAKPIGYSKTAMARVEAGASASPVWVHQVLSLSLSLRVQQRRCHSSLSPRHASAALRGCTALPAYSEAVLGWVCVFTMP